MQPSPGHKLVRLANGAASVHSLAYAETMHPAIGPAAEAEALYVRQLHLRERLARHEGAFVIWDVGLGAAGNAATVLRATRDLAVRIRLVSFDGTVEPLRFALAHKTELGFLDGYADVLHRLALDGHATFSDGARAVDWQLQLADFPALMASARAETLPKPHAILFDPYSPAKNPAMWTRDLFADLFRLLDARIPCALATYSRSTMTRAALLWAGVFVGAGEATGRKEETTLAANAPDLIAQPLGQRWWERALRSDSAEPLRTATYQRAPLSEETRWRLSQHPQLCGCRSERN